MDDLEKYIDERRNELDSALPNDKLWAKMQRQLDHEAIEETVAGHRELLNSEIPSPKVWQALEARLDGKNIQLVPMRRVWQVAASVAIFMSAVFAWQLQRINREVPVATVNWRESVPELASAEQYYKQVIAEKRMELQQYDVKQFGLEQQGFDTEMMHLDSAYRQLGQELLNSQSNERVVSAMIENLQMRMAMITRQLEMMRQLQEQKQVTTLDVSI